MGRAHELGQSLERRSFQLLKSLFFKSSSLTPLKVRLLRCGGGGDRAKDLIGAIERPNGNLRFAAQCKHHSKGTVPSSEVREPSALRKYDFIALLSNRPLSAEAVIALNASLLPIVFVRVFENETAKVTRNSVFKKEFNATTVQRNILGFDRLCFDS